MLKTISYISDLNAEESYGNLKDIYSKAKTNNLKNNITGILIYNDKNFLQVFEGEEKSIDKTFNRILKDERHQNIFVLIDTITEFRFFEDYHYGFTIIKNKDALKNLKDYFQWLKEAENKIANEIIVLVENFIRETI